MISARFGSVMFKSGMVENVWVAARIASLALSVPNLFPLPVPWPTCGVPDVGQCVALSAGMVEHVMVAVEVSFVTDTQA